MFPEDRMMEVIVIGALALIVIGPKDLPIAMRKLGQFIGKMRGMAAEFRASFDELARQSELEELRKEVEALRVNRETLNPFKGTGLDATVSEINQHLGHPPPMTPLPSGQGTEPALALAAPAEPVALIEPPAPAAPEITPVAQPPKAARRDGETVAGSRPKAASKPSDRAASAVS